MNARVHADGPALTAARGRFAGRAWLVDLGCLAAGVSLVLAFAPFGVFPLAVVAPAVLFLAWLHASPARAAWRGWLFGMGQLGVGVAWIQESFQFSQVSAPLAWLLTGLLVAYLALFSAAAGYLGVRLGGRSDARRLLLAWPALWVLAEWVRGWMLTGFTWLQLGYSQADSPLAGYLPIAGVYGTGWVVAVSAGLLLYAVRGGGRARWLGAGGAVALWVAGGLLVTYPWTRPAGDPLPVALIQGNVPQHLKWRREQRPRTLERYLSLTRRHPEARLIVWPETALPGFAHRFEPFLAALGEEVGAQGIGLILGAPEQDTATGRYYNAVMAVGDGGGTYRKRHLVPFGEFLPLKGLLGDVVDFMGIPMSDFSAGDRNAPPVLRVAGHTVGITICYEAAFGAEVLGALPESGLLVNVSNDAWFGDSLGPHQNLEITRVRALETGRPLLRATNTGITAIIGPDGRVQARVPQFEVATLAGEVRPMSGRTPYSFTGDLPTLIVLAALVAAPAVAGRRRPG